LWQCVSQKRGSVALVIERCNTALLHFFLELILNPLLYPTLRFLNNIVLPRDASMTLLPADEDREKDAGDYDSEEDTLGDPIGICEPKESSYFGGAFFDSHPSEQLVVFVPATRPN
jgi:hypothetical protein